MLIADAGLVGGFRDHDEDSHVRHGDAKAELILDKGVEAVVEAST